MLQFESIPGISKFPLGNPCLAFYKYDGSNLRFEWSPKRGWHKFGSRTQMIDRSHPTFGEGISLFEKELGDFVVNQIRFLNPKQFKNLQRITAFAEFYGQQSFAGSHVEGDPKTLRLFDVHLIKTGFIDPYEFRDLFSNWEYGAKVVYHGRLNKEVIETVRKNELELNTTENCLQFFDDNSKTKLFEGVICKGRNEKPKPGQEVWMTKIKTLDYFNKLRNKFADDWEKYGE